MIVSVKFTPRLFKRAVVASFKDKPVTNGLILLLAVVLATIAAGPFKALGAVLAGILISSAALVIGGLVMYILYRNKRKVVPVSYDLKGRTLKITYGDRSSLHRVSRKLQLDSVERVWFRNSAILIKQKGFVYPIALPEDSRSRFIEQMRANGWFDRIAIKPRARLAVGSTNLMLYVLIILMVAAILPTHSDNQVALSSRILRKPLTSANIITALNSQRNAFNVGALQPDATLTQAAASACKDMTDHTYFGDLSGQTSDVYERGTYVDRWVNEVGAATHTNTTPDQVASHWVNSGITGDAVLDKSATLVGVAICRYTVNHSYDDIVVVELGA